MTDNYVGKQNAPPPPRFTLLRSGKGALYGTEKQLAKVKCLGQRSGECLESVVMKVVTCL